MKYSLDTSKVSQKWVFSRYAFNISVLFPAAGQYLFQAPNQYIFHGAEVYSDSEDDTSSSRSSDSDESESSADGMEDDSDPEEAAALPEGAETTLRDTIPSDATSGVQTDSTSEKTESTMHL